MASSAERDRRKKTDIPFAIMFSMWGVSPLLLLVLVLLGLQGLALSPVPATPRRDPQIIRSEVDLVVLPVTVTDHHGDFVPGLTKEDFRVYENGRLQTITLFRHEDEPVAVGLVVDCSGSMSPNRNEVVEAAKDFLLSSNPADEVFVVNFNERASLGLPPTIAFTSSVSQLEDAVLGGPTSGETALYDALALGLKHLATGAKVKKALLLISDGGDNASHENFQQILTLAQRNNTIVYAIGILSDTAADVNPGLLRKLAKATGGRAYFPKSAAEVPALCKQIARDLREQYTIGYTPSDRAHDGTYRAIRLDLLGPRRKSLVVRTRAGYYAPSDAPSGATSAAAESKRSMESARLHDN
ncbi:MAG: VWA domain-containing protein [Candidatus Acidiferrum sp.]